MRKLCLGIDLGTTNSKAAFLDYRSNSKNISPEKLSIKQLGSSQREEQRDYLPSVVLFETDGNTVYVGEYARRYSVNFPDRSVRSIKRLMGKSWRHKVPGWNMLWTPQGISAFILRKIYNQATESLHDSQRDLDSVTISVPASFGSRQRQATVQSAKLAGFVGDVRLIDEPSAALIHAIHDRYETGQDFDRKTNILVFDMGGGTLDVSLAVVEPKSDLISVKVLSRSRYTELAGIEFDLRLSAYLVKRLEGLGLHINSQRDLQRVYRTALFDLAEPLKMDMSAFLKANSRWGTHIKQGLPFDFDPNDLNQGVTIKPRERQMDLEKGEFELENIRVPFLHFSQVLAPFFAPVQENDPDATGTIYGPIIKALKEKGISEKEIDIVLLHGGMCQLPLIRFGLQNYFPENVEITPTPDAMTSVAQGAALYQASNNGHKLPIVLEEPALFESIFYETEEGFEEVVNKDCREGEEAIKTVPIKSGAKVVRLRFYHGFSQIDPLLTHDRDLLMELDETLKQDQSLELHWKVNRDRTVTFAWRDPNNGSDWKNLREALVGSKQDWYPQDIYNSEMQAINQAKIL